MADSENQQPVDTTQQVTSQTPTTKTKNPKRVAAGKAIAEKTRLARDAQKKALDEANAIIVGIYYKREEIKALFAKKPPPVEPPPVEPKKEGRIRNMD